jgi:hypothetical protein
MPSRTIALGLVLLLAACNGTSNVDSESVAEESAAVSLGPASTEGAPEGVKALVEELNDFVVSVEANVTKDFATSSVVCGDTKAVRVARRESPQDIVKLKLSTGGDGSRVERFYYATDGIKVLWWLSIPPRDTPEPVREFRVYVAGDARDQPHPIAWVITRDGATPDAVKRAVWKPADAATQRELLGKDILGPVLPPLLQRQELRDFPRPAQAFARIEAEAQAAGCP